ncbi:MAG: HD domain-containing protein [Deltaproteobacteria bacterium]|nr:HD domain-containing protein [Deltaproteobacteria bacterium]
MNPVVEKRLKERIRPLLEKGRGGDWGHTLRVVDYGRRLLRHEEGEEDVVIPALYLHDIGWGWVDTVEFVKAAPSQKDSYSFLIEHMKKGAEIAGKIVKEFDFKEANCRAIEAIVAVHDLPEQIFRMKSPSALLVMEADRLDRFGPESLKRFRSIHGRNISKKEQEQAFAFLRMGLATWFKTQTAKAMARDLAASTGLIKEKTAEPHPV